MSNSKYSQLHTELSWGVFPSDYAQKQFAAAEAALNAFVEEWTPFLLPGESLAGDFGAPGVDGRCPDMKELRARRRASTKKVHKPVANAAVAGVAHQEQAPVAPVEFAVILTGLTAGADKIRVIRAINDTGVDLRHSKSLVDAMTMYGATYTIKEGVNIDEAEAIKKKFTGLGATVVIASLRLNSAPAPGQSQAQPPSHLYRPSKLPENFVIQDGWIVAVEQ